MSPLIDHGDDVEPFDIDAYDPEDFKRPGYLDSLIDNGRD